MITKRAIRVPLILLMVIGSFLFTRYESMSVDFMDTALLILFGVFLGRLLSVLLSSDKKG